MQTYLCLWKVGQWLPGDRIRMGVRGKEIFFFLTQSFALVTQAGVQCASQLTATFTSGFQAILLPLPPE